MDIFDQKNTYIKKGALILKVIEGSEVVPRHFRLISSTNIYHIMLRGINKERIFYDNIDRNKFLKTLKNTKEKYEYKLYAYCLMDNHVHLLVDECDKKISNIMQSIGITYALYFNKKYERVGHLFQNRYNSKCVESEKYFLNLIRYIHRNPENAKICSTEEYIWSSFKEYLSNSDLVNCHNVLNLFDKDLFVSKKKFKEFNLTNTKNYADELEYEFINNFSDEDAKKIIKQELNISNVQEISNYNIEIRNQYIRTIKRLNGISKSQISRILNLDRKIIERA